MIELRNFSKRFGGLQALDSISLLLPPYKVTSVIGPNGAGKSTLVNCITGLVPADQGEILIDGKCEKIGSPSCLVDVGISRTFQNIRLFDSLSVYEHILLSRRNFFNCRRSKKTDRHTLLFDCTEFLTIVGLEHCMHRFPHELSYGERRRLEIARALATSPRLLLLDEPAAGSTPSEQIELADLISRIAMRGVAVMLIEHHIGMVGRVSDKIAVLNFGKLLTIGSIDTIRNDPEVVAAYLGKGG